LLGKLLEMKQECGAQQPFSNSRILLILICQWRDESAVSLLFLEAIFSSELYHTTQIVTKLLRPLCQAFFHGSQKIQGENNSSPEKNQAIFGQKNSRYHWIFLKIRPQKLKFKLNFLHLFTISGTNLPPNLKWPNNNQKSQPTVKFWPKSKKLPLIFEKTQANAKKTQGIWLKTQCTRGKSLLNPL